MGIRQTGDRAVLNWESFNVGKNTTVEFQQQPDWAVLNRVNDPQARPSQIQGRIKGEGTVLIANRNGVVFSGTSQVDTRSLVAAAANIADAQFRERGIYGASDTEPTFTDALGKVEVRAGARLGTHEPRSVTQGGGYVLLLGAEVENAGSIATPRGQTALAAADSFVIRRGAGTDANAHSTTRGNEIAPVFGDHGAAGQVLNRGMVTAAEGDITLTGRTIAQQGVLLSTTSVNARGTVHLSTRASDAQGGVTFANGSVTAVLPVNSSDTALDAQRRTLIDASLKMDAARLQAHLAPGAFDNLSWQSDRRDLSRVEVVSGGTVEFQGGSLTLATGGQVSVASGNGRADTGARVWVGDQARIDVAGAVGVGVAMEANNIAINIQGNEQRDAPVNRDSGKLNSSTVWVDRRKLVYVPAGVQGYANDRWYTGGGLLEVGGYVGTTGRGIGEWLAEGGTVTLAGREVVTQSGSAINVSGGTLDVRDGFVNQSWMRGVDGRLYEVSRAPGDMQYEGLYKGFEDAHARWGEKTTQYFNSPLIGAQRRFESGYTVGMDAGQLRIESPRAILEGELVTEAYRGERQTQDRPGSAPPAGTAMPQDVVPQRGRLALRTGVAGAYDPAAGGASLPPAIDVRFDQVADITRGLSFEQALPTGDGAIAIDTGWLAAQSLGGLAVETTGTVGFARDLRLADGGELKVTAPMIDVAAAIVAPGGRITLTNLSPPPTGVSVSPTPWVQDGKSLVHLREGAVLDVSGRWVNRLLDPQAQPSLAWLNGGTVRIETTGGIALDAGSLIDVSSGAAVQADGRLQGGRGGDLLLISAASTPRAGIDAGGLRLDGELRAVGVNGGGTLTIQAGGLLSIGGQAVLPDGTLAAGRPAPVNLILADSLVIPAGTVLSSALSYVEDRIAPGQALDVAVSYANTGDTLAIPIGQAWDLAGTNMIVFAGETRYSGEAGDKVPAGAVVTRIATGSLPAGYRVAAEVFPKGLPVPARTVALAAGATVQTEIVLPAGKTIAAGSTLPVAARMEAPVPLDPALLRSGFAHYAIGSETGVAVGDGARLSVAMPVYRLREGAQRQVAGGAPASQALEAWLPPLYDEDPQARVLTQRAGASLQLSAGREVFGNNPGTALPREERGGSLYVGRDAVIEVDPGQAIDMVSRGQITIDGTLRAPSGRIALQLAPLQADMSQDWTIPLGFARPDPSIWIGEHARLDAAAQAAVATDAQGRAYGTVRDGGTLYVGGNRERGWGADGFVVLRPGSVLDASGTQARLVPPGEAGTGASDIASAGGSITLASFNGIDAGGTLRAAAGGTGAAGGALAVHMDVRSYTGEPAGLPVTGASAAQVAEAARQAMTPREITLTAQAPDHALARRNFGQAVLGLDQIAAGGFGALDLAASIVRFDGNLDLSLARSLRLSATTLAPTGADDRITVRAPYVQLAGFSPIGQTVLDTGANHFRPELVWAPLAPTGQARIAIAGDLIDVDGAVRFGGSFYNQGIYERNAVQVWRGQTAGFDQVVLDSTGDLRFLGTNARPHEGNPGFLDAAKGETSLYTSGDLLLSAARIYPGTHARAEVGAGVLTLLGASERLDPNRSLRIVRSGPGGDVLPPPSVFGTLGLLAAHIEHGGVVQAPLGLVQLGFSNDSLGDIRTGTSSVTLLPGSITSVSAAGLVLPYGGTSDGVDYLYDGQPAQFDARGAGGRGVVLSGRAIDVQAGARLDLSGGGELAGAGFVSGRGGSVDVRLHPLIRNTADGRFVLPELAGNPVYAVVPGWSSAYAPVAPEAGAGNPAVGRQITVPAGVPGLPAGTYTLLPSNYALMPGAFRVELHEGRLGPAQAQALRNGSWSVSVTGGIANTGVRDARPGGATLTPAATVRRHAQYNETGYSDFARSEAARLGGAAPALPADAKQLALVYPDGPVVDGPALQFAGLADFRPAAGGRGGQAVVRTVQEGALEIVAGEPTPGFTSPTGRLGTSVNDKALNAIGAPRLVIGGQIVEGRSNDFLNSDTRLPIIDFTDPVRNGEQHVVSTTQLVVLRSGAALRAPEVFLASGGASQPGAIVVEPGARIDLLASGLPPDGAMPGTVHVPHVALIGVSNGALEFLPPVADTQDTTSGRIDIGVCAAPPCAPAALYSQGAIAIATTGAFNLGNDVRYGTRNLALSVAALNVGSAASLAEAAAAGVLAPGLSMSQAFFSRLLDGDPEAGAPALERLTLTAGRSINFHGPVDLSTYDPATGEAKLSQLVFNTPALYGAGRAGERAVISTGTLYWNGVVEWVPDSEAPGAPARFGKIPVSARPGEVIAGGAGTGEGALEFQVGELVLGYAPGTRVSNLTTLDRLALGFDTVSVHATDRITANNKSTLAVYRGQVGQPEGAPLRSGGHLNLATPLLTGEAGSVSRITAGGAVTVSAPAGTDAAAATRATGALGAELSLAGDTVTVSSPIVLPSGKLTLSAVNDLVLADGARLDVAGRAVDFFDQTRYSAGGDVVLESAAGNIAQAAGARIDLSARNNHAGSLRATALGEAGGRIDLAGAIVGGTGGSYDAGGTMVPFEAAGIDLRGQRIEDFAGLNARLNEGGVVGARHFRIKQGSLTVSDEVRARDIGISVDGGSLRVDGKLDASGFQVGTIRLSARDDLTINGTLDAHGTGLRVDSRGQVIEAPNRAIVELGTTAGRLRLAPGALIDLRAGTDGAVAGVLLGTLDLNVPRLGANDAAIDAAEGVTVRGAMRIAVNAFRSYEPAAGVIDQGLLDAIHGDSTAFIGAAWRNAALQGRLAALKAYGDTFHLRPGVALRSTGDMTVTGDLDLSGYRYGPGANPAVRGSGEAGVIVVRAGGDLTVNGSITDGFDLPPATPDDNGWVLTGALSRDTVARFGGELYGAASGDAATRLHGGSASTMVLGFDAPIRQAGLNRGVAIPFEFFSRSALSVPSWAAGEGGWLATADIYSAAGTRLYRAGDRVGASLPAGTRFGAGTVLPPQFATSAGSLNIRAVTVPAGTPLNVFFTSALYLNENVTLAPGTMLAAGLTIAGNVPTRATDADGRQGRMWALAPMLPAGSESWSIRLAAGADLAAADSRALRTPGALQGKGRLTLDDLHVVDPSAATPFAAPSVVRTGTGDLELLAGGDFRQQTSFGIYTAGTPSAPPGGDDAAWNLPRGYHTSAYTPNDSVLGPAFTAYESLAGAGSGYRAWYPTGGGNLRLEAQGHLLGDAPAAKPTDSRDGLVGDWLWRQGGGGAADVATAWWINFGAYVSTYDFMGTGMLRLAGFTGMGTLGGGNVSVAAGGDAGLARALNLAVGGTGRVDAGGALVFTGGGDLALDVGGQFNAAGAWWYPGKSNEQSYAAAGGSLTNLRGRIDVRAGAIGGLELLYGTQNRNPADPRIGSPFGVVGATLEGRGGPALIPGDAVASLSARGDLVLGEVQDPGRVEQPNATPFTVGATGASYGGGGRSWFTLWTPRSGIDLFSAGGNLSPMGQFDTSGNGPHRPYGTDMSYAYPASLTAVAASGSIFHSPDGAAQSIVLAPSPEGRLELLAADSIHANGQIVSLSGADPSVMATPFHPAFAGSPMEDATPVATNVTSRGIASLGNLTSSMLSPYVLFPFAANTPTGAAAQAGTAPVRFYAREGDIVGLHTGAVQDWASSPLEEDKTPLRWYSAARPARILAGRDIVGAGTPPGQPLQVNNERVAYTSNLFVHGAVTDVSVVQAGRDIVASSFRVAGPGTLEVIAGRNIYQADKGEFVSLGPIPGVAYAPGATGADIAVLAGVGARGPDYAALAARYLDLGNQAEAGRPLADQPGKVVQTYGGASTLGEWLRGRYADYDGQVDARGFFAALPPEQQRVYLREVYFAELKAGGREYNDVDGPRQGSYLRGRQAIAALFPQTDAKGEAIGYGGDFTMFSTRLYGRNGEPAGTLDSGIRTLGGGDIQMLAPGGRILVGVEGLTPGGNAGLLTQGQGDIALYSKGSLLLGLSRIMTTFGGHIQAWSAEGDINAGRGAKTTLVYTPPLRVYDDVGNVKLSPNVPSGGAGIATLNPIPEVPPGDVDLVAPLGTIDAGEAGIRVSGNVNLAALQIVNAANIQVKGEAVGIPTVAAVNVGALVNASAAASQATAAAQDVVQRGRQATRQALPSVFTVRVLGFGGEEGDARREPAGPSSAAPAATRAAGADYDDGNLVQVLGHGRQLDPGVLSLLTDDERRRLRQER
ncbi:filamentous haemagglutinin family protein [Variovorax sp.]|uniref:filamentous haemagglutinin family protein n=1 Tax=Variovorax sp. TaxID=1871043 RepID=UPI001380A50F|nr:filamentous haemagglutinin family protein [Variovorax sp.]KAF1072395.1 MAG: Heme/hemopexin-binding protein [Variovorax sp.]